MKKIPILVATLALCGHVGAQQSTSYKISDHVFNTGGHPEAGTVLTSASHLMTMDAIGESVVGSGLSSASYRVDGSFMSAYPPPGEVTGLRFTNDVTLAWAPEKSVGGYNLYRDWLSSLSGLSYGQCKQYDLPGETATESDTPTPPGRGFF